MKRPAVVIVAKGSNPKTRLAGTLGDAERRLLEVAMLSDVLLTLTRAALIRRTFLVSPDDVILKVGATYRANTVREEGAAGVNHAAERGMAASADAASWLILPADIPFLGTREIRRVMELNSLGARIVLGPSREFDGTNLLLMERGSEIRLSYDRDSFRNHLAAAAKKRISTAVYCARRVMLDIDTRRDLKIALDMRERNETTRFFSRIAAPIFRPD